MRVLIIEILFIASTLPVWRSEFDVTDYIDPNSYVFYAGAFWILVFTLDILRIWLESKPRKHRIHGFEAIEPGVPHARFIQKEQTFIIFLKVTLTPWADFLGRIVGAGVLAVAAAYFLHSEGWIVGSTMIRLSFEATATAYALTYPFLAVTPTKIEINPLFVKVNRKRLARAHFGQFHPGGRLSYSYADKLVEFGGYWKPNEAIAIVTALNDLYEGRRWLPQTAQGATA